MFAVAATGCGSDDKSSSSGGSSSQSGGSDATPSNVDEAVAQCLKKAGAIKDADSRRTATEACKAAKTGDASKVKDAARAQCLDLAKRIPVSSQRDKAEEACKRGTK